MKTPFTFIVLMLSFFCISGQELPRLLLKEHQGDFFYLEERLVDDRNYVLTTTANWCGWCKRAFEEWTACYDSLASTHNVEIIAISSDGYEDEEQILGLKQIEDIGLPIKVWFTTSDSIREHFESAAYPTNYYVREGKEYLGPVGGYAPCEEFQDSLSAYFDESQYRDDDLDGYSYFFDCDDSDPFVNPGVSEIRYNGKDDDCNPETLDDDLDKDGFLIADDCDDSRASIYPGADEVCNFLDDNCDGEIDDGFVHYKVWWDGDNDGYGDIQYDKMSCQSSPNGWVQNSEDCDDDDPLVHPGAIEIPNNGVDENCDGLDLISSSTELEKESFVISPNPVIDNVIIRNTMNSDFLVRVTDYKGKEISTFDSPESIDVSFWQPGIYLFHIRAKSSEAVQILKCLKL